MAKRKREGPQSKDTHPLPSFEDNFAPVYPELYVFILAMHKATTDEDTRTSLVKLSITWIVSVYSFEEYKRKLIGLVGDVGVASFHQQLPAVLKLLYKIRSNSS